MHNSRLKTSLGVDESKEGDFFYNEEEVLNGVGGENRAALLECYDAMLEDSEQPELEEACYHLAMLHCNKECISQVQMRQCSRLCKRWIITRPV